MSGLKFEAEELPLRWDSAGTIRVGSTRVTLDSLIYAFQEGSSPEAIAEQYPTVSLADIYLVIGFYLRHADQVDDYLQQQQIVTEATLRELRIRYPSQGLRQRLLARRAKAASA